MEEIKKYVIDKDYKNICDFIASVQNNPSLGLGAL